MPKNRHPNANQSDLLDKSVPQRVGDVVAFLNTLSLKRTADTLADLPIEQVIEVFDEPELNHAAALIELLPTHQSAAVLAKMSADRAADLLQNVKKQRACDSWACSAQTAKPSFVRCYPTRETPLAA
jgi:Mg/Co/Ni transporter MgtE